MIVYSTGLAGSRGHRRDVAQRLGLGRKSVKAAGPETSASAEPAAPAQDIAPSPASGGGSPRGTKASIPKKSTKGCEGTQANGEACCKGCGANACYRRGFLGKRTHRGCGGSSADESGAGKEAGYA